MNVRIISYDGSNDMLSYVIIEIRLSFTHRKVHQMLKHIVFSQKKAVKKKKCEPMAEMT